MKRRIFFIFILLCSAMIAVAHNGILVGKIVDEQSKLPIENVFVSFESGLNTESGQDGRFIFENVETGSFILSFSILGYENKEIQVEVKDHETTELTVKLTPKSIELREVVISGNKNPVIHTITKMDISLRTINSTQDILRIVPGLFIAQHAGGGKAEQIFLRGFDVDHGTDIAITVDGMPVNMVSHAHGQGYADLHFVIPELVENVRVNKGCYDARTGNFATAGAIAFQTKNELDKNQITLETGMYNHFRMVTMVNLLGEKAKENQQNWYAAGEYLFRRGYFQAPDNLNRLNFFTKYQGLIDDKHILTADFSHFNSRWNASGQIPESEVLSENLSLFGSIDSSEGGNTSRTNANLQLLTTISANQSFKNQLFISKYNFDLFSNFTFYLHNPQDGDAIHQSENRTIYGYKGAFYQTNMLGKVKFDTEIGVNLRIDEIKNSELSNVKLRNIFLKPISSGEIQELNAAAYFNEDITFSPKLHMNLGMRMDAFNFNYNDKLDSSGYKRQFVQKLLPAPKASIYYTLNNKLRIFANSGVGFHSNDARVVVAQKGVEILPKAFGAEVGAALKAKPSLFVHASVWWLRLQQEFVYVGDEAVVEASGQTQRAGVDISLRWQPFQRVTTDFDLNIARPRAIGSAPKGENYIPLAPVLTSIGGIKMEIIENLFFSVRYRFLADRPANEFNTIIAKGYFLADGTITYTHKKIELGIYAENLLNTKWKEAQFETTSQLKGAASPTTQIHYTAGTPFAAKLKISYQF
ncbi:MAG: TonB-dependent receptor [Bacteroidia bacterium]|nr:TonB-dependent receptor [Bacteroidia bacterium]